MSNPAAVRKLMKDGASALKEVMSLGLADIANDIITKTMKNYKNATKANQVNAIKGITISGIGDYKKKITEAIAEITSDSLELARKEIPRARNVKLADTVFEKLSPKLKKQIKARSDLLVGTQVADLEKTIFFQFTSSYNSTDSDSLLKSDLVEAGLSYIEGAAIEAGSNVISAETVNSSRNAFFFQEDTLEEVDAFQFVNGDPVTAICQDLNGTIFAKDDPNMFRYTPPLHWNCKSIIIPILKGNLKGREIEPLKPSTQKLESTIQFSENSCGHCACEKISLH